MAQLRSPLETLPNKNEISYAKGYLCGNNLVGCSGQYTGSPI